MIVQSVLVNTNAPDDHGDLVSLTLTRVAGRRALLPDPAMLDIHKWRSFEKAVKGEFANAAEQAFRSCWPSEDQSGVIWSILRHDGGTLPNLTGPSLGAAFAIGLTLLSGQCDHRERVAALGLPHIIISAALGVTDSRLNAVGGIGAKLRAMRAQGLMNGIQMLAVSKGQDDIAGVNGLLVIKADRVSDLIVEIANSVAMSVSDL